jgi:hypothetical protein
VTCGKRSLLVKEVVNVVKDVAKSDIGRIALTIGATMALGPVAAGFGIGTAGTAAIVGGGMSALTGGNVQDILKGAALGYIGGTIAPSISSYMPGAAGSVLNQGFTSAALGTGFGLAAGMSPQQALRAGAVGGLTGAGVAYGQQQGYLPGGQPAGSRTTAPTDAAANGSNLSLAPIEGTGTVGTATENLTPVVRQDALSGQQFSVGMDGKEYLVYKDAAGNNQYVRADAVNTSQPMAPRVAPSNLSVADKYSPYYTEPTAASMDARQALLNKTYGDFQKTVPINSSYTAQDPSLVNDYSLQARPVPTQGDVGYPTSAGTGLGMQGPQPVSLSGTLNAPPGGVGLTLNAPGLTIPQGAGYTTGSGFVPTETGTAMQQGNAVGSQQVGENSFVAGAKDLYNRASDAVVGGYNEYLSPNRPSIQQAEQNALLKADQAVADYQANSPKPTQMGAEAAYKAAYESNSPGFFSKYAPLAGATLGATYLAGGFDKPTTPGDDTPVYDPAYTGTDYMRDNPQAFSGSLYNYQSQGAGAYDPYRETRYAGELGAATRGVVTPTGIMQAQYSPDYGRRVRRQQYYSPFIGTAEPVMAAKGGSIRDFPRKTGPINGPGTGTSDDIPAMLSDGEFVFTARAVRNAGGGSRRKGAARMYKLMKSLEKGGMVKG